MKILLLGKNGQVGWELQRSLAPLGELVALDRQGAPGLVGDVSDLEGLAARYAARLEGLCAQYPLQWFNFFDFWQPAAATGRDAS